MSATFLFPLPCPTAHNITKGNQCYLHKYIGAHTRYHKTPVTLPTQSQLWPSKATTIFTPTFSPRGREGNFFKVYTSRVKPSCPVLYLSHLEKKKKCNTITGTLCNVLFILNAEDLKLKHCYNLPQLRGI